MRCDLYMRLHLCMFDHAIKWETLPGTNRINCGISVALIIGSQ